MFCIWAISLIGMGSVSTTAVHATCTRLTKGLMGILFSQLSLFGSLGRFLFFFPSFSFSFFFLFKTTLFMSQYFFSKYSVYSGFDFSRQDPDMRCTDRLYLFGPDSPAHCSFLLFFFLKVLGDRQKWLCREPPAGSRWVFRIHGLHIAKKKRFVF